MAEALRSSCDHLLALGQEVETPKGPGVVCGYAKEILTYCVRPKTPSDAWRWGLFLDREKLERLNPA